MADSGDKFNRLRAKVLDELLLVQGRIALATKLKGADAKAQLRLAHGAQRDVRLADAADFLAAKEDLLIREFADGKEVDPARVDPVIIPVRTPAEADLFRFATLQWSVPVSAGYGRRSRFLVRDRQNGKLIAIFALGDPVIAQSARDGAIGWHTEQRNQRLYNVYDAFVLGAVEPYRQLLGGKLVALLTLANETRDFLYRKYAGSTTEIRGEAKDPTPVLITTSSALGRSSVYNRVTYNGTLMFHSVGFTKGFGHFQFSEELFAELLDFARGRDEYSDVETARSHSTKYGSGPNWRFRVLRTALNDLGIPSESLQHNIQREVFLAPLANNWDAYLRGEEAKPRLLDLPAEDIAAWWRQRWAIGRATRHPQFKFWHHEDARLSPQLIDRPFQLAIGRTAPCGRVEMGDFHLSAGTRKLNVRGHAVSGVNGTGTAYISRLEGPELDLTVADITWSNGEREVRGWALEEGDRILTQVMGRLRISVTPTERFRGMSAMELRLALPSEDSGRLTAGETSAEELSTLLGFDIADALDKLGEASVGTRGQLFRDEGPRRAQLCVVFRSDDTVVPAVAWCLTRALPVLLGTRVAPGQPPTPVSRRAAPRPGDLDFERGEASA